eukprot:g56405.t1
MIEAAGNTESEATFKGENGGEILRRKGYAVLRIPGRLDVNEAWVNDVRRGWEKTTASARNCRAWARNAKSLRKTGQRCFTWQRIPVRSSTVAHCWSLTVISWSWTSHA